jgi:glycosyltransferase involved in cell wall biosynthesis
VESVERQRTNEFEYILIDGGSTDGTKEYLQEKQNLFTYWSSEKDKGIYDAQNKGIARSKGKYLLFLNAGDTLYDERVIEKFLHENRASEKGIVYGNSNLVSSEGKHELLVPPASIELGFWFRKTLNHQAVFMKKELFGKYGLYDLQYRFCADFDLLLHVYVKEKEQFVYFPHTVCNYYEDGFSSQSSNYEKVMAERDRILRHYLSRKQYSGLKRAYIRSLPVRKQILTYIYQTPFLSGAFKKVYPLLSGQRKK